MNEHNHDLPNTHQTNNECCPECGAPLHIRNGKQGPFLGCTAYPKCNYLRPLHEKSDIKKVLTGSSCPVCSKELVLKQGRFGLFIGCSGYPDCSYTAQLSEETKDEQIPADALDCPVCKKGKLIKRHSRYGKTFYACNNYPNCKYLVNSKPVNEFCPDCHWPILIERKTASSLRLICPKKGCGYRSKPI